MTAHSSLTGLSADDHTQYIQKSLVNAKGDILVASADNVVAPLTVGTDGYQLVADSTQSQGVRWAQPPWITSDLVLVEKAVASSALSFVTVTAAGTAHTKGAYSTVIASTSGAATLARIRLKNTFSSGTSTPVLVDIATGAAASEVIILANLQAGYAPDNTGGHGFEFWIPIAIPAGTRLSARCQGLQLSKTVDVNIALYNGGNRVATAVDTIGVVSASSRGTNVTSATSNVEGAWTQITASTANAYGAVLWGLGCGGQVTVSGNFGLLDLGVGGSGSEVPIISDIVFSDSISESIQVTSAIPFQAVAVAAGSRIAARIQYGAAAAAHDLILYGLR